MCKKTIELTNEQGVSMQQMKTEGEKKFLDFCISNSIRVKKIEECDTRTADFIITVGGTDIIVEIKDVGADSGDKNTMDKIKNLKVGKAVAFWDKDVNGKPGEKIDKSRGQIRETLKSTGKNGPAIVLIFDSRSPSGNFLSNYVFLVAMKGYCNVRVNEKGIIGKEFGKGQRGEKIGMMNRDENKIISAVGKLILESDGNPAIHLYHNRHAYTPINPEIFKDFKQKVKQYIIPHNLIGNEFSNWKEITL